MLILGDNYMKNLIILLLVVFPSLAWTQDGSVKVKNIAENGNFIMENGDIIKPAGIIIKQDFSAYLQKNWQGIEIATLYGNKKISRSGEYLAQIKDVGGRWLQNELIGQGAAVVYVSSDNEIMAQEMLKSEATARISKKGIWADDKYGVITDKQAEQNLETYRDSFKLVEGTVFEVKTVKDKVYINFGSDWKTDFTVLIRKESLKKFSEINLDELKGRHIRVRGWIESYNGPMIEVYNKWHLEIL